MAGWTDYCPDWSSKDKLRLCSVYDALSALTAALNERASVVQTYLGYAGVFPMPDIPKLHDCFFYLHSNFYHNFDYYLNAICGRYVNPALVKPDMFYFGGFEWTWAALLDGEPDIALRKNFSLLDWVYQRYKMINKLKWTSECVLIAVNPDNPGIGYVGNGESSDLSSAYNIALNNVTAQDFYTSRHPHSYVYTYNGNPKSVTLEKVNIIIYIKDGAHYSPSPAACRVDLFCCVDAPGYIPTAFDGVEMFTEGYNHLSFPTVYNLPQKVEIPLNFVSAPDAEHSPRGCMLTNIHALAKFDVINGFQFKDW